MEKLKNVLSLFDGIGCLHEVLKQSGVSFNKYYASEIDPSAVRVAMKNHPKTLQVGNIRELDPKDFKNVSLVGAGFPCTDFSLMGNRRGMITIENIEITSLEQYLQLKKDGFEFHGQSYLFWEMIRMIKGIKPKYIFLENVTSIDPKWFEIINNEIGEFPYRYNASRLTTQNRDRYYWTNLPQLEYPEDRGFTLDSIIPGAIPAGKRGIPTTRKPNGKFNYKQNLTLKSDGKANCLVTGSGATNLCVVDNVLRTLTPEECEIIQTLKEGYTNIKGISKSTRYKLIGNGWSIETVIPFFKGLTVDNRRK